MKCSRRIFLTWSTMVALLSLSAGDPTTSQFDKSATQNMVCDAASLSRFNPSGSAIQCALLCAGDAQCASFYFNVNDFSCDGSSVVYTDFTGCTFVDGAAYYTKNVPEPVSNWAQTVVGFSSQYSSTSWAASQILGAPNVYPSYGNNAKSWAPKDINAFQFIEVGFQTAMYITQVDIYETDHAGAVKKVSARDSAGQLHVLWETPSATVIRQARIFSPTFTKTSYKSSIIRLDVDQTVANTWIEIDAIALYGDM